MNLYPLKLSRITIPKIWGEEIWHMVQMGDRLSVVENGYLAENDLTDLLEVYMGELVGDHVYERFGNYFPLLLKIINTTDDLSIQVHPDNEVAMQNHQCYGKSEMWYVLDAKSDTTLISGFNQDTDADSVRTALAEGNLLNYLNVVRVQHGDVVALPHGRVHALRKNISVAEIQQNSDITYRLFDYNRKPKNGVERPLHVEEALQVLDFKCLKEPVSKPQIVENGAVNIASNEYFVSNLLSFNREIGRDYAPLDSFVAYMCVEGGADVSAEGETVVLETGDTVLIPASLDEVMLRPHGSAKLLEVYVP